MNDARPTKEELVSKGWKKATKDQIAAAKSKIHALGTVTGLDEGAWCYSGPCVDGGLTCYLDEDGNCTDCYHDPLCE